MLIKCARVRRSLAFRLALHALFLESMFQRIAAVCYGLKTQAKLDPFTPPKRVGRPTFPKLIGSKVATATSSIRLPFAESSHLQTRPTKCWKSQFQTGCLTEHVWDPP